LGKTCTYCGVFAQSKSCRGRETAVGRYRQHANLEDVSQNEM
jgi:hypothetical protein